MDAASAGALTRVVALTRWVGTGRASLTQTGRLTMADARELVSLLGTGDEVDPVIGDRVFRTRSSEDLRGLATVLAWAKAAGLIRVVRGRLVAVKKNARLLDRPTELWVAMFEAFGQLGEAICPSGWYASPLGQDFADGIAALFAAIAEGGGAIGGEDANEQVWSALVARYRMDDATDDQLRHWRNATDRDVRLRDQRTDRPRCPHRGSPGMLRLTRSPTGSCATGTAPSHRAISSRRSRSP